MITVAKLRRKPRHFQTFTGLSVAQFDLLLTQVTVTYEQATQDKRQRPDRQRQAGAGHPFRLDLPERLLMGLIYLRLYVRQSLLGYLFNLDESNISRELHARLLPTLLSVLPTPLRDAPLRAITSGSDAAGSDAAGSDAAGSDAAGSDKSNPNPRPLGQRTGKHPLKKRIGTLQELMEAYPEIQEVLLDATEQPVPQPKDKQRRKLAYSGKQHQHTVKTQILATRQVILHVFGGLPGCLNDMLVLRASGVLHQVPAGTRVRLDKGYQGTASAYPTLCVQQPIKKTRGQAVTVLERAYNHLLSVLRMPVEHHFARLKKWECLTQRWRGRTGVDENYFCRHEDYFCTVAGLLNFRQTGRLELMV
jgi:hypothetical protein